MKRALQLVLMTICFLSLTAASLFADYVNNGNGTVTDTDTGLTWQQETPDNTMTWQQALAYCEELSLGGQTDWRLPTKKELRSLVDSSRYNPAINTTYFPDTVLSGYWSSTTSASMTSNAWFMGFDFGFSSWNKYSKSYYVRAVRGEPSDEDPGMDEEFPVALSVSPGNRDISRDTGSTTFDVSKSGTGTMNWRAAVTTGSDWLRITSGAAGTDSGTITCEYDANTGSSFRTATIRVTATGAEGSPQDVTVTQAEKSQPVGENPGVNQHAVQSGDMLNLMINTTNTHGDTPVYEWFVFTAIMGGNPLPLYLIADTGIFCLDEVINNLYAVTFSFEEDQLTSIAILSMADLGLGSGDSFLYGYAYQNQTSVIILDNFVTIAVE